MSGHRPPFGQRHRGWIPAFAGMTDGGAGMTEPPSPLPLPLGGRGSGWIPAFAGMTDGGAG